MPESNLPENWSRVVISWIKPSVDGGEWPAKRSVGEDVTVWAGLILDGHDKIAAELHFRHEDDEEQVRRMALLYNDEYHATFGVEKLGRYHFHVEAWIDAFGTWQDQFERRVKGGDSANENESELHDGAGLLRKAAAQASKGDAAELKRAADAIEHGDVELALGRNVLELAQRYDPRDGIVVSRTYEIRVDPELARFAAWYEFFPRSAGRNGADPAHATLDDAAKVLPRIKDLGFDIVYLPPVHPIGRTHRKGRDNAPKATPSDPGSPWAIGAREGGHKSVHPDLGGLEAFDRFVACAEDLGLRVALDIAFQTSPDHPYVKEHPEWFRQRFDGTIRYAENPPKKYQDVYPLNFESSDWQHLWRELKSVFEFWIGHGVRIFRVDNPHTKPFAFWQWCLEELRTAYPDTIFLAEAFSRPKIMYHLAKIGYNNSYTYFTWRNTKEELISYCRELYETEVAEYFRPNFWPNTPDILHDFLVHGGRPAHVIRFVLAATLSSAYGLYGPPFEHVDNRQHPDREEYAQNEKYEVRAWNWRDPNSLQPLIRRVNRIRRDNPALQYMRNLRFHQTDNPHLLAYSKQKGENLVLVVVNLDPYNEHQGWVHLPLDELEISEDRPYELHDLLGGERYLWSGVDNYVKLSPHVSPAHIFRVHHRVRTEADFPYFA